MKKYMQRETGVVLTGLLLFALVVGMIGCPNPAEPEIETKLLASDGAAGDCLGWSVSIDGDYAIVGAYEDDDKGSAYIFVRSGTSWTQQAKLAASDGAAGDWFGYSVGISGDYAIVGAYGDDDGGDCSGSAYIFVRSGTSWTQQAKFTASDGAAYDYFGFSVGISGDYAIVGAWHADTAYVFMHSGTDWIQQDKLMASDGAGGEEFGNSVSISGDYAIVGACYDNDQGTSSGSAYIFVRNGTDWTEQDKLLPSDGAAYDFFGYSVCISGDYAIVGAFWEFWDDDPGSGSAYIFVRSGTSWTEHAKLTPSDGVTGDCFGRSVCLSGDYAIVGAVQDDDQGTDSGSAYIFVRSGTSWAQQAKLTASDGAAGDYFGYSVGITGEYVIVGACHDDDQGDWSGSAYIYD